MSTNKLLDNIAKSLDISPSDFKLAQKRFKAVKDWLNDGNYSFGYKPDIYLQGSFRLGTVVRPYYVDREGCFDIDQVCELIAKNSGATKSPEQLKNDIGNRLKDSSIYRPLLDSEGKRCWTIEYAKKENKPGFHIDILPAAQSEFDRTGNIDITHKEYNRYSWSTSNPKGYYSWFKSRNKYSTQFMEDQRSSIFNLNRDVYAKAEDVPKQLFRTSLQRAIQIMKRHRDVNFVGNKLKPISIIITTITAKIYRSESDIAAIIEQFCNYALQRKALLLRDGYLPKDDTLDFYDGTWFIPNPVDQLKLEHERENFADRWNVEPKLVTAFFDWCVNLKRDLINFKESGLSDDLNLKSKSLGSGNSISSLLLNKAKNKDDYTSSDNQDLLDLIHLGIEGKVDWHPVIEFASNYVNHAVDSYSRDVALINLYQIYLHKGENLGPSSIRDIERILYSRKELPPFVLCCHILLGTANINFLKECIRVEGEKILEWPILRLYSIESHVGNIEKIM